MRGESALQAQENIEDLAQFVVPFRLVLYRLCAQNEHRLDEQEGEAWPMDEGRKRVIGIMAAILASLRTETADCLFRTPQGSPRTDELIVSFRQACMT